MELSVLDYPEPKKVGFEMNFVCVCAETKSWSNFDESWYLGNNTWNLLEFFSLNFICTGDFSINPIITETSIFTKILVRIKVTTVLFTKKILQPPMF